MKLWKNGVSMGDERNICKEFNGEYKGNGLCMVDGFPLHVHKGMFDFKPESQTHEVWNPDDFLDATGWGKSSPYGSKVGFSQSSLDYHIKKIRNKEPLGSLFIDKDVDDPFAIKKINGIRWVPDHEGRHRALACKQIEGCHNVPVIVYHKKQGYCVPVDERERRRYILSQEYPPEMVDKMMEEEVWVER